MESVLVGLESVLIKVKMVYTGWPRKKSQARYLGSHKS
jgi:hypothetical protein